MEAIIPFVEYYQKHPYGFAETDGLNDIDEAQSIVNEIMFNFNEIAKTKEKQQMIKKELDRWKEGRNAGAFGRYIGRLYYLKNKK
jgi:hypothetical protein